MTRAVQVAVAGFKSGSQPDMVYDLGAQTLVVGAPGAGKTRLLQAMQYAALGYVPSLGKAEAETAALMQADRMSVRVTLDDGRWFERSLARKGERLQNGAACSWAEGTSSRIDREIVGLFGATDVDAAECVAIGALLGLPPTQMAMRVENVLAATCMAPAQMLAAVRDAVEAVLAEDVGPAATRPAVYEPLLTEALDATERRMNTGGIVMAITHAAAQMQTARASAAAKVKTRAVLEDRLREMRTPTVARSVLDSERMDLVRRIQTAHVLSEQGSAWRRQIDDAERRVGSARLVLHAMGGEDEVRRRASKWRADAARLEAELQALSMPEEPATGTTVADRAEERDAITGLQALVDGYKAREPARPVEPEWPDTARQRKAMEVSRDWLASVEHCGGVVVEQACSAIEVVIQSAEMLRPGAGLAHIAATIGECVKRIRSAVGDRDVRVLKNARQQAEHAQRTLEQTLDACSQVQREHDAALAEWREAHGRWAAERAAVDEAERRLAELRTKIADRVREAKTREAAARERWMVDRDAARRRQAALVSERDNALQAAMTLETDITGALRDLGEAESGLRSLQACHPTTAEDVRPFEERLRDVEADLRALDGFAALSAEMRVLVEQVEEADASAVVWSAVSGAAKRVRDADLQNRGGPIVAGMTTFLRAAGRTEIPFLRADGGRVALGWLVDGRERPIKALCGMEAVLVSAALGAALVALRGATLGWLLIDANEVGVQCFDALAAGCEAVGGGLGNVVVATNLPVAVPSTWTRIDV